MCSRDLGGAWAAAEATVAVSGDQGWPCRPGREAGTGVGWGQGGHHALRLGFQGPRARGALSRAEILRSGTLTPFLGGLWPWGTALWGMGLVEVPGPRRWPLPVQGEGVKGGSTRGEGREHQASAEVEGEVLEARRLVLSCQGPPLLSPSSSPSRWLWTQVPGAQGWALPAGYCL